MWKYITTFPKRIFSTAKFVHIMHNDKFNKDIVEFFNKEFNKKEHLFVFYGGKPESQIPIPQDTNVRVLENSFSNSDYILNLINKSKKTILHGLFNPNIVTLLSQNPHVLQKCSWIIWGGDLYDGKHRGTYGTDDPYEKKRENVIKNMGGLITFTPGDIQIAKQFYGCIGKEHLILTYLSNCYQNMGVNIFDNSKKKANILVNNSGAETGNHLSILKTLEKFKDKIEKVICPLSYSCSDEYRDRVISFGNNTFKEKFSPITHLLPKDQYYKMLLSETDIGVFGHERQQAYGNIIALLSMGKKVYINKKSTLVDNCKRNNQKIFYVQDLQETSHALLDFSEEVAKNNIHFTKKNLSYAHMKKGWDCFLSTP